MTDSESRKNIQIVINWTETEKASYSLCKPGLKSLSAKHGYFPKYKSIMYLVGHHVKHTLTDPFWEIQLQYSRDKRVCPLSSDSDLADYFLYSMPPRTWTTIKGVKSYERSKSKTYTFSVEVRFILGQNPCTGTRLGAWDGPPCIFRTVAATANLNSSFDAHATIYLVGWILKLKNFQKWICSENAKISMSILFCE